MTRPRRRAIGAEVFDGGVHFRVWAPAVAEVAVALDGNREVGLQPEPRGYHCGFVERAGAGARYRLRLDRGEAFPDPASRFQPEGPHGSSQVVDCESYEWTDSRWNGPSLRGAVISEIHIGTFTPEGTYAAAAARLDDLADAGINVIELMPVHEFPGRFGWGYDGVDLWAPTRLYGEPDDLRRLVDAAHSRGIAVILDVVYNHLGPDGCYLSKFTPQYFTDRYENEWGEALNFDGDDAAGVREFFSENAAYWIDEFHFDGLRIDATQSIHDRSRPHVIREVADAARAAASGRSIILIGENEPQDTSMLREHGLDTLWNDDWHHAANVALSGRTEAYYTDYRGRPQEFVSMATLGFLYQGQRYRWQKKRRGTPSRDVSPERLVLYLQNHDQIANSLRGERLHDVAAPGELRAMTALLLLSPQTPMLFQGQEFGASAPFVYFADHEPELAARVAEGRHDFLAQFRSISVEEVREQLPLPHDPESFARCKLEWSERKVNTAMLDLHRDLIRLRREDPTFSSQRTDILSGSVLGKSSFILRWFSGGTGDRLLIVNLGREAPYDPAPEPLLAPPAGTAGWEAMWSSEAPRYGGSGIAPVETDQGWTIPGQAAVVMKPVSSRA